MLDTAGVLEVDRFAIVGRGAFDEALRQRAEAPRRAVAHGQDPVVVLADHRAPAAVAASEQANMQTLEDLMSEDRVPVESVA